MEIVLRKWVKWEWSMADQIIRESGRVREGANAYQIKIYVEVRVEGWKGHGSCGSGVEWSEVSGSSASFFLAKVAARTCVVPLAWWYSSGRRKL